MLKLRLKLLCGQKLSLLPEVGRGKDLLSVPLILIIALVCHQIEGGNFNSPPRPALFLGVFLNTTNRVIQGIPGACEDHRRTLNGTTHNIAGDHFPLVIKPLPVLGFLTTFHTVIEVENIGGFGQTNLTSVNGTTHAGGETGLGFQVDGLVVSVGLYQSSFREHIVVQVFIRRVQIFQTAVIEALYKVITGSFHEGSVVRVLPGDHIDEIDTSLTLTGSFRHGNGQKTQFSVKHILETLHHGLQIVPPGSVKPLFGLSVKLDVGHESVKIVRCFKQQTFSPNLIEMSCFLAAFPDLSGAHTDQLLVQSVSCREILGFPPPAKGKQVIVCAFVSRSTVNSGLYRKCNFLIIHRYLQNEKGLPVSR